MEVLVALVVLSFGLLGQAGLQAAAMKVNQGAMLRSHATTLAYDILDRMRANSSAATGGSYLVGWGAVSPGATVVSTDLSEWKGRLAAMLPSGDGRVCRNATAAATGCGAAGNFFLIEVRWVETDESNQDRVLRAPIQVVGQL
ncbi:MAG: type IV pilus modification protein PilV [Rhodocyclales bacterium]|nr:type IV pilus modification protein PilV [Rhodocyclales bacterium]